MLSDKPHYGKINTRYAECQNIKLHNAHSRWVQSFIHGYATYPHHSATYIALSDSPHP